MDEDGGRRGRDEKGPEGRIRAGGAHGGVVGGAAVKGADAPIEDAAHLTPLPWGERAWAGTCVQGSAVTRGRHHGSP
jgi:hypothetical protein